jgi:uncharacterized protein
VVTAEPGVYVGTITHRRYTPRAHQFHYALFLSLLDIDRIDEAMAVSPLTSLNRWNLASFHDADHIGDPAMPLRDRLRDSAAAAGRALPDGRIYLLTHLRYAGYVFNPISLYYCFDRHDVLRSVLADVRNTYGGRRSYWLDPADQARHRFRAFADKNLYVSPYMEMEMQYEFLLTLPGQALVVHMNVTRRDSGERVFDATLDLERRPWSAVSLRRTLLSYPLMTAKVIGAIHFEALRLRLKGLTQLSAPQGRQ